MCVCKKCSISRLAKQAQAQFLLLQLELSTRMQNMEVMLSYFLSINQPQAKCAIFKFTYQENNENILVSLYVLISKQSAFGYKNITFINVEVCLQGYIFLLFLILLWTSGMPHWMPQATIRILIKNTNNSSSTLIMFPFWKRKKPHPSLIILECPLNQDTVDTLFPINSKNLLWSFDFFMRWIYIF